MMTNFVKCRAESLVPVRNVAAVAFDPFGSRWYVERERMRAAVGDLLRVVEVA